MSDEIIGNESYAISTKYLQKKKIHHTQNHRLQLETNSITGKCIALKLKFCITKLILILIHKEFTQSIRLCIGCNHG